MFINSTHQPRQPRSLEQRLADTLEHISKTEGKWFDGSLDSIEARKNTLREAMATARQAATAREITSHTMGAMEIEQALKQMYASVDHVSQYFVSDETADAQRELPHYRINVMEY